MGTVFLGRHIETDQEAAVKVLPPSMAREPGFVARFTREIDSLTQLTNPHVVELYESGVDGETYFYVMEYVEGETLTERLKRDKRIPWRIAIDFAVQICSALKAAHDAGIVHRDLKPSNLMITPDGNVKLTDFGVAQVFAAAKLTVTGGIIGTAEYMSPEQAEGKRATKKSDLYSLGAVLYVMLTGRPPFSGRTTLDIIQKHRYGQFDPPSKFVPDIPRWLEDVVNQLLEKEPDKRFPNAYVVSLRLQEIPKKVDLAMEDVTDGHAQFDSTAPTIAETDQALANSGEIRAGSATLMRDLMHLEMEREKTAHSPIERFFNNTWVLLGALVLVVGGSIYLYQSNQMTPQERFDEGEVLMNEPEGPGWITARDEYFLPLLEEDAAIWEPQVSPYLRQVKLYELKRSFGGSAKRIRKNQPNSEIEALLHRIDGYREIGDDAEAERLLTALHAILAGDADHEELFELTKQMLDDIREQRSQESDRDDIIAAALKRADDFDAKGESDQARNIWLGIIALYGDDLRVTQYVAQARQRLETQTTESQ